MSDLQKERARERAERALILAILCYIACPASVALIGYFSFVWLGFAGYWVVVAIIRRIT
jgi:hypothetical protein